MSIRDAARASPAAERDRRRVPRDKLVVLIAVVALGMAGVALRLWAMYASPAGAFDSDSAVPALMARHILRSELPVFYWGQPYGGSLESFVEALVFAVFPPWVLLAKLVPVGFCATAAVLTWRIGCRLVGRRAAALGAALFWSVPFTVWYSTKTGPYWGALAVTLLAVLLLLRLAEAERPAGWEAGGLGLAAGVAWWANPSVLLIVPVAALFLAPRLARHWRWGGAVALGALAGAGPWILFNLRNGWMSLDIGSGQLPSTYGGRLGGFFTTGLPMAMGLRLPFSHEWLFGPVGIVVYAAALATFGVFAARTLGAGRAGDRRLQLLCTVVLVYPLVYALSPYTWYVAQPRYLLFLLPFLALLAGMAAAGAARGRAAVAVVAAVVVAAGVVGVAGIGGFPADEPKAAGAVVPASTAQVHALLRRNGVTRAYADYWIAYRLTFESGERTIVAPIGRWRYKPYQDEVAAADRPAYVFLRDSPTYPRFLGVAAAHAVGVEVFTAGRWAVVVPGTRVLPADWPEAFGCPEQCGPAWP